MKNIKNKYELIEKFNSGEMTGTELSEFLQQIKDNPELAFDVEFSKKIDNFFLKNKSKIELREQLEQIYEKTILNKQSSKPGKIKIHYIFNLKMIYKIAAGILLLFALGALICLMLRPPKNERLYSKYFRVYESGLTVRGNAIPVKDKFHTAMEAYDNGDFVNSAILFKEICNSDTSNFEAFFFKGISEMKNQDFNNAIISLNKIAKNTSTLYNDVAIWYLALSYLGKNDILNTKKTLQEIIAAPDHYKKEQTASLLKDLE